MQARCNLAQCFCPATGAVRHHRNGVALIAEVFCQSHTAVQAGFSSSHGHVRGIGEQDCALHQWVAGLGVLEFGEFHKNVCHFVAALATTNVNHNVSIAEFGDALLGNCLARTERSRNRSRATRSEREQHVENSHTRQEWQVRIEFGRHRTGFTHSPSVIILQLRTILERRNDFINRVLASRGNALNYTRNIWWNKNFMHEAELWHCTKARASSHMISNFHTWGKRPFLGA